MMNPCDEGWLRISIAIPTLGREQVLLDTVQALLRQVPAAAEVLVVDQTPQHEPAVDSQLRRWNEAGAVRWLRLERPSVPSAMNHALHAAHHPVVLFLDDDIVPSAGLIAVHAAAYADPAVWAVTGQVLQPGQEPMEEARVPVGAGIREDLDFPFHSSGRREVHNCMAGNLSVRREQALAAGGFDENFVRVAYRFETEFCRRLWAHGGRVVFEPRASIRHLQAACGGVRSFGDHLTTWRPHHAVGDYYFTLRHGHGMEAAGYALQRLRKSLFNRHHLRRPWWIPLSLVAEGTGLLWAAWLRCRGHRNRTASREG